MSLSTAIRAAMTSDAALVAFVADRIRPVILDPGDARPAITYRIVNNVRVGTQDGGSDDGECLLQVAVWSEDYDLRSEVGDALISALHIFDDVKDGYDLTIFQQDQTDDTAAPDLGEEFPIYADLHQFKVLYNKV